MKDLAVNPKMRLRAQYSSAIMVRPIRRVSVTLNDEPDKLKAFPALTPDFADKVLLLLCRPGAVPIDTTTGDGWDAMGQAVRKELPAFAAYIEQWPIPAELLDGAHVGRFGFKTYHHPALVEELFSQSIESDLIWIIDNTPEVWADDVGWRSAHDIRETLANGPHGAKVAKLPGFAGATGTFLKKLADKFPERIEKRHIRTGNLWLIRKPGLL